MRLIFEKLLMTGLLPDKRELVPAHVSNRQTNSAVSQEMYTKPENRRKCRRFSKAWYVETTRCTVFPF